MTCSINFLLVLCVYMNFLHLLMFLWGFANASEKNRLEAFLRRAGKSSYYTDDCLPTVAALCEQADEQLFRSIKYKPTHPLRPLLPPERSTPYCTRL